MTDFTVFVSIEVVENVIKVIFLLTVVISQHSCYKLIVVNLAVFVQIHAFHDCMQLFGIKFATFFS